MAGLILALATVAAAALTGLLVRTRFWHLGPCPACQGRRGRGRWSKPDAYNRCRRCGGSSERIRPLSRLIWPKWRREARRRRERIKEARRS